MRKVFILFTLYSLLFSFPALAQSERKDSVVSAVTEVADTTSDNIGAAIAQQADSALDAEKPLKKSPFPAAYPVMAGIPPPPSGRGAPAPGSSPGANGI